MSREHLPFIDWMKAIGIVLIVFGHVAGGPINHLVPPIYPKQLGVAFFMFVIGFSLARETRPRWHVLFNRLFEIYVFGVVIALILSAIMYSTQGTLNLSNYLPFVLGANVLFNHFPANPTTWYIGTYLHVLVLWAFVVRPIRVRGWVLAASAVLEVALRALLLVKAGEFVAYMLFPNWMTVFLLGTWFGQRDIWTISALTGTSSHRFGLVFYSLLLAAFAVGWTFAVQPHMLDYSFPFMRLSSLGTPLDAIVTAAAASIVYVCYTLLVFEVVRRIAAPAAVRFIARNTLIVFIAHMPVFYAVDNELKGFPYFERALIQMLVCLVGLAVVSEIVRRVVRPTVARNWLAARLAPHQSPAKVGL